MQVEKIFDPAILRDFSAYFDKTKEDLATTSRGEFLSAFKPSKLSKLTPETYCIGHGTDSFCTFVEVRTRPWANILGATAEKFGIYFGRKGDDQSKRYRFTKQFGSTKKQAFLAVREALVELVKLGGKQDLDFHAIDENKLSQMFKAKIVSLYFPERFINICSRGHLSRFAVEFAYPANAPISFYQHLLAKEKKKRADTRKWSNPRFMEFLYFRFKGMRSEKSGEIQDRRRFQDVDMNNILKDRARIGRIAEKFARKWEENRLRGLGKKNPVGAIKDRRNAPRYGFDFESAGPNNECRYIEVKAVATRGDELRFFMSENEREVSSSARCGPNYYFYLVRIKDGKALDVDVRHADSVYAKGRIEPASYEVNVGQ